MGKLLPLRLILPTVTDLSEMIGVLQIHKEGAMRGLNMEKARNIQSEIEELQDQINKEERYLLKKRMDETKCGKVLFPTKKKMAGILRTKEKKSDSGVGDDDGATTASAKAGVSAKSGGSTKSSIEVSTIIQARNNASPQLLGERSTK